MTHTLLLIKSIVPKLVLENYYLVYSLSLYQIEGLYLKNCSGRSKVAENVNTFKSSFQGFSCYPFIESTVMVLLLTITKMLRPYLIA